MLFADRLVADKPFNVFTEGIDVSHTTGVIEVPLQRDIKLGRLHRLEHRVGAGGGRQPEILRRHILVFRYPFRAARAQGLERLHLIVRRPRHGFGGGEAQEQIVTQLHPQVQVREHVGIGILRHDIFRILIPGAAFRLAILSHHDGFGVADHARCRAVGLHHANTDIAVYRQRPVVDTEAEQEVRRVGLLFLFVNAARIVHGCRHVVVTADIVLTGIRMQLIEALRIALNQRYVRRIDNPRARCLAPEKVIKGVERHLAGVFHRRHLVVGQLPPGHPRLVDGLPVVATVDVGGFPVRQPNAGLDVAHNVGVIEVVFHVRTPGELLGFVVLDKGHGEAPVVIARIGQVLIVGLNQRSFTAQINIDVRQVDARRDGGIQTLRCCLGVLEVGTEFQLVTRQPLVTGGKIAGD